MKWLLKFFDASLFTLKFSGGGGSSQPASQTVNQSNLPEYARPYFEDIMNRGQAVSQAQYTPYTGQRQAGFTPMQEQGFQGTSNLGVSPLMQPATGLTGAAGIGGLQAGQNYAQQATSPGAMQSYMSPYMQNVVDFQKTQAVQDYGRQLPGQQAAATRAGAFGGSRQAIVESEAQRNLQNQLAGIQATGTQQAYDQANKNLQFGSSLNLQGLDTAGKMGAQFGQLGQTAFGQQAAAAQAQQTAGATQQAQAQTGLDQGYEEFMRQQTYPDQQLQRLSSLLRGSVVSPQQTEYRYQATPSAANQMATLGLGAYGVNQLFGGRKEGGEIKKYAVGGIVGSKSPEQQYKLALQMPIDRLLAIMQGQPGEVDQTTAMLAYKLKKETQVAQDGVNAQDQASEPSILQQQIAQSGIEAVPVENMGIPDGGIAGEEPVAMARGGLAAPSGQRYEPEDTASTPFGRMFQGVNMGRKQNIEEEYWRRELMKKYGAQAGLGGMFTDQTDPERARAQEIISRSKNMSLAELRDFVQNPEAQVGGPTTPQSAAMARMVAQDKQEGRSGSTPAAEAAPSRKSNTRGKSATGIAALVPSSGGEPDAAAYGPSSVQGMAPGLSRAAQESDEDMLKRFAEQAGTYTKSEREALRRAEQESQTKGETGLAALRDESRGVAALRAAQAFSDPRNQGSRFGGIGAAFGAAGETGADYGKQKRGFEKDLDKSRMDMAKADLAFKQGDFDLGSKLMGQSQTRMMEAAKLAADKAHQAELVRLKGVEMTETERSHRANEVAKSAEIASINAYRTAMAGGKGGLTPAQESAIKDKAKDNMTADFKNPRWLMDFQKLHPGKSMIELQRLAYEKHLADLTPKGYSFGAAAARTSIQIPDADTKTFLDATK